MGPKSTLRLMRTPGASLASLAQSPWSLYPITLGGRIASYKGMKITSIPLEKLTDHCIEHKTNKRNDEGCDPRSQLYNAPAPLCTSFFLMVFLMFSLCRLMSFLASLTWLFIERAKRCRPIRSGEL